MEFNQILALIIVGVLLTTVILLFVMLRKRFLARTVRVMLISKDGLLSTHRFKNLGDTFKIDDEEYVYDAKYEVRRRFWKEIYYLKGIPNPVQWFTIDKKSMEFIKVGKIYISAQNLKNIIRGKFFQDITTNKNDIGIIVFILILGVLTILNLYLTFKLGQGVSIADSPENKAIVLKWLTGN